MSAIPALFPLSPPCSFVTFVVKGFAFPIPAIPAILRLSKSFRAARLGGFEISAIFGNFGTSGNSPKFTF
jgi:hypothetical protein